MVSCVRGLVVFLAQSLLPNAFKCGSDCERRILYSQWEIGTHTTVESMHEKEKYREPRVKQIWTWMPAGRSSSASFRFRGDSWCTRRDIEMLFTGRGWARGVFGVLLLTLAVMMHRLSRSFEA